MNNVPQDLKRQSASLQSLSAEGKKLAVDMKGFQSQEDVLTAYHSWFQRVTNCLSPLLPTLGQADLLEKMERLDPTRERKHIRNDVAHANLKISIIQSLAV